MPISRHPLSGPLPSLPGIQPDPAAIQRLRDSLAMFTPRGTELTRDFYAALFARYPGVRVLFPTDMTAQEAKLFDSLQMVVNHAGDGPGLRERLMEMGKRHEKYGAKIEHYPLVCSLLLETMAKAAGPAWTAELAAEWAQALQLVADAMIAGYAGQQTLHGGTRFHTATRPPDRGTVS